MKIIIFFSFTIFSLNCFSQKAEVTKTADGKGITVKAQYTIWYDALGKTISKEQFNDSLKTGNYLISIFPDSLTAKTYLLNKDSSIN